MTNLIDLRYSDKSASKSERYERKKCCACYVRHGLRIRYSRMISGVTSLSDPWRWPEIAESSRNTISLLSRTS